VTESSPGEFKIGDYRGWIVVKVVHVNMLRTGLSLEVGHPPVDQAALSAFRDAVLGGVREGPLSSPDTSGPPATVGDGEPLLRADEVVPAGPDVASAESAPVARRYAETNPSIEMDAEEGRTGTHRRRSEPLETSVPFDRVRALVREIARSETRAAL
jgi:hypothetical protein